MKKIGGVSTKLGKGGSNGGPELSINVLECDGKLIADAYYDGARSSVCSEVTKSELIDFLQSGQDLVITNSLTSVSYTIQIYSYSGTTTKFVKYRTDSDDKMLIFSSDLLPYFITSCIDWLRNN